MTQDRMWQFVDEARRATSDPAVVEEVAEALVALLVTAGNDTIREFQHDVDLATARAYGWPLWGAAYVINGGCSDDGFDYFLGWLVAQGREVFARALADPDTLADVVTPEHEGGFEGEDVLGAAWTAYEDVNGEQLPPGPTVDRPELGPGWDFDDEAEMRRRYPRLTGLFLT